MDVATRTRNGSYVGMKTPTEASIVFGRRLKAMMDRAGLTQEDMGRALGLRQSGVSDMCAGLRQPRWDQIVIIATALGVTADEVLGLSPRSLVLTSDEDVMIRAIRAAKLDPAEAIGKILGQPQPQDGIIDPGGMAARDDRPKPPPKPGHNQRSG